MDEAFEIKLDTATCTYFIKATAKEIAAFYRKELVILGYTEKESSIVSSGWLILLFETEGSMATITASRDNTGVFEVEIKILW